MLSVHTVPPTTHPSSDSVYIHCVCIQYHLPPIPPQILSTYTVCVCVCVCVCVYSTTYHPSLLRFCPHTLCVCTVPLITHPSSDSVHNDGEHHIPYITIFPNSTINKLYAWAKFQLSNSMIQEQLRCGCQTLPLQPKVSCYLRIYQVTAATYQHIMIDYNTDNHNMVSIHPITVSKYHVIMITTSFLHSSL